LINQSLPFTAVVTTLETTLPVTFTWSVDNQIVLTHTTGLTDTISINFDASGVHHVRVEASNRGGSVTEEWAVMVYRRTFLPYIVLR
jgi:hypothetical protein